MTTTEEQVDDFLEHYGVKGMKWGQRKAARQANRAMNKESRKKDWAEAKVVRSKNAEKQAKSVDRARANIESGKNKQALVKAKAQYKQDKATMGSREARKILNKTKDKNYQDYMKSQEARDGKEMAKAIAVSAVGAILISALKN